MGTDSFRYSPVVCHDVIAAATRQTLSRYTQMRQAPDPSPNTGAHTWTHRCKRGSASSNHLRPPTLSETLMPGLRSLTYFYSHTKAASHVCCLITHSVDIHCSRLCLSCAHAQRDAFTSCIFTAWTFVYIHECVYSRFESRVILASLWPRQTQNYSRNNPLSLLSVSDWPKQLSIVFSDMVCNGLHKTLNEGQQSFGI